MAKASKLMEHTADLLGKSQQVQQLLHESVQDFRAEVNELRSEVREVREIQETVPKCKWFQEPKQ